MLAQSDYFQANDVGGRGTVSPHALPRAAISSMLLDVPANAVAEGHASAEDAYKADADADEDERHAACDFVDFIDAEGFNHGWV